MVNKFFARNISLLATLNFGAAFGTLSTCALNEYSTYKEQQETGVHLLYSKETDAYRDYENSPPKQVENFYMLNHINQSFDFVLQKKAEFCALERQKMSIWEAMDQLNQLIDESDPDMNLPQCYHFYQTAEALRRDGYPRWFILAGFIHDLGKILAMYGEPQWAVVGDTFPVGCAYSEKIVFPHYFQSNPDVQIELYQTKWGIYSPGCGFSHLHMSWGHDEYLYQVVKDYLPAEAAYIIRFHSFYAAHKEGAYEYFMDEMDDQMLPWLQLFSRYDLYSKTSEKLDIESLKPYYQALISEFFPEPINW